MERVKKALDKFFIDGLSAMAHGLFATLIIGTIIQQIGTLIGGGAGDMIFVLGKVAASLSDGYSYNGRTLSPEKVAVYTYEKPVQETEKSEKSEGMNNG